MSLRNQILANLKFRLGAMPEIDAGDVVSVQVTVYTDQKTGRRLDRMVISAAKQYERGPAGIEVQAELDTQ